MLSSNHAKCSSGSQDVRNSEVLRALTPMFMAFVGGLIGVVAIAVDGDVAAFGLAGTAIAGAAGLSQSHEPNSQRIEETLVATKTKYNDSGEKE